ncbi:MAG: hypothetical protein Rubg2KO_03170 [Rubricoccaceae bacterium]
MSRAWMITTPLSDELATDGRAVIEQLRSDVSAKDKSAAAFAFVYAATEQSLVYHFREPLTRLGVGMVTRKTLDVALDLALKGIRRTMKSVLNGMDDAQLRGVADAIEHRLYPDPHG